MAERPAKTKAAAKAKAALKYKAAHKLITQIHKKLGNEDFVFRGVPKMHKWKGYKRRDKTDICSSIFRNYRDKIDFNDKYQPVHIESEIVTEVEAYFKPKTTTIEILSVIRHFGGDTTLIDFSKDVLVALFFACQTDITKDGQLFALPTSETETITEINYEEDFSIERGLMFNKVVSDQKVLNTLRLIAPIMTATNKARVVAQKSIFIHAPRGYVDPTQCIIIPIRSKLKPDILAYLDRFHDINQRTIYNDLHGLIEAQEHGPQARLFLSKGNQYFLKDNFKSAVRCFNKAIPFKQDFAEAYYYRGMAKFSLQRPEDAIADFDQAIKLNPDFAGAYVGRGLAYHVLGKTKEAEADIARAKELGFVPSETDDDTPA